jgi:serine/threonine protein kinase
MEYKILGKGNSGLVIHPCIGCSEKTKRNPELFITKLIGNRRTLDEEIRAYNLLPEELDNKLYYKFYELCEDEKTKEELEKIVIEIPLEIKYANYKILNSTFIKGLELANYLNEFKTEDNQTNRWNDRYRERETIPVIPTEIFMNLSRLLELFCQNIQILNSFGVFHNDIQITNIMINHEHDKLYLIDFGRMSKTTRFNAHDVDIGDVNEVIKEVVKMGLYNDELKEIITELKKSMKEINIAFLQELLRILTSLGKGRKKKRRKTKERKTKRRKTKRRK